MIELILLFFLSKKIGALARQKGLNSTRWIIFTILSWIVAELFGIMIGILFFSKENVVSLVLVGLLFGVASYHGIRTLLQRLPDADK